VIFNSQDYIKHKINIDLWENSEFKGYRFMDNKQKGTFGEYFISNVLEYHGIDIGLSKNLLVKSTNCGASGPYDRVIDGFNTEIKFSLSANDYKKKKIKRSFFSLNHVSVDKEWERLIFCGINFPTNYYVTPNDMCIFWITKEMFKLCLKETCLFTRQQGGKYGDNDDWMCMGKNITEWTKSKYAKNITEW
jgi:hypothetical protein